MPKRLCLLAALLTLAGCQTIHRPSEADLVEVARHMPTEKDIQARFDEVAVMYREICTAPEYEPYFTKTPCLPALATKRQLNDKTKITPQEASAMRGVMKEVAQLNDATRDLMKKSGIDAHVRRAERARSEIDPAVLENQEALLARAITWGAYNQKRIELSQLSAEEPQVISGAAVKLEASNSNSPH